MAKRVPIHDVAEAAGVSRQTVTRAFNDRDDINIVTKERVLTVGANLGYRPSRFARRFVERQKTHTLGLFVASFKNPYYTEFAGEMLSQAAARGLQVVMASSENHDEAAAIEMIASQVDVLVGHFISADEDVMAAAAGVPVIILERADPPAGAHAVDLDLRRGVRAAIAALRDRGSITIGTIDSDYTMRDGGVYAPSPRRGYFAEFAGPGPQRPVVVGHESITGGAEAMIKLMTSSADLDTVLVFNDVMAIEPALSTICIDRASIAANALDIIDRLAATDFCATPSIIRTCVPRMVWRESA